MRFRGGIMDRHALFSAGQRGDVLAGSRQICRYLMQLAFVSLFAVACSQGASFHNSQTKNERQGSEPDTGADEAAVERGMDALPLPEGIEAPVSPFAKGKIQIPAEALELSSDQDEAEAIVMFYRREGRCLDLEKHEHFLGSSEASDNEWVGTIGTAALTYLREFSAEACFIGAAMDETSPATVSTGGFRLNSNAINHRGLISYDGRVQHYFDQFEADATVAVVDTGIDMANKDIQQTDDYRVTSIRADRERALGDNPVDSNGHGTRVASVIAHKEHGLGNGKITIIPIKVSFDGTTKVSNVVKGIQMAVNKNADVVNLSMGGTTRGCNPAIGYAVYKAIEKGTFFVFAAGNGLRNDAGANVGFPVTAARDDGPAHYGITASPACWSRYFLGAVGVAAIDGQMQIPEWSNFGSDLELAAPGVDIPVTGLNRLSAKGSGTSYGAPLVASAAALAIAEHKAIGANYTPWFIENLLVESASRNQEMLQKTRFVRAGSILSFNRLITLLESIRPLRGAERAYAVRTINPRSDEGWDPGNDKPKISRVVLSLDKSLAQPGDLVALKAVAFYKDGTEKEITDLDKLFITTSNSALGTLDGFNLNIAQSIDFAAKEQYKELVVSINFTEDEVQVFDSQKIMIENPSLTSALVEIELVAPTTPVRIGQAANIFKLMGKYEGGTKLDHTGGATWSSSNDSELKITASPGVVDAVSAVAGKSYTLSAFFKGMEATIQVTVVDEQLSEFYVHSYLGEGAVVDPGQNVVVEARFILDDSREQVIPATWYLDGKVVATGTSTYEFPADETNIGTHEIYAEATFKSIHGNSFSQDSYTFEVGNGIDRVELHAKRVVIPSNQEIQYDLRVYRKNNSYIVVTEDATWTSSDPAKVQINSQGIAFAEFGSEGGEYTISASYLGFSDSVQVFVFAGSTVTGSQSDIDHIDFRVNASNSYCMLPGVSAWATYQDGAIRYLSVHSSSISQKDQSGQWVDATTPLYGGRIYRFSVTYNDGVGGEAVESANFVMPKQAKDKLDIVDFRGKKIAENHFGFKEKPQFWEGVKFGVCGQISYVTAPHEDLGAEPWGQWIWIKDELAKPGTYSFRVKGTWTGDGYDQVIESDMITADFRLRVPDYLEVLFENQNSYHPGSAGYGVNYIWIRVYDEDGEVFKVSHDDLKVELFSSSGQLIESAGRYYYDENRRLPEHVSKKSQRQLHRQGNPYPDRPVRRDQLPYRGQLAGKPTGQESLSVNDPANSQHRQACCLHPGWNLCRQSQCGSGNGKNRQSVCHLHGRPTEKKWPTCPMICGTGRSTSSSATTSTCRTRP